MATYFFSSFTQEQAQAFNAATDSILFNTPETGADFRVSINTLLGVYSLTTTTGHSFDFGPGLLGATFTLSDNSVAKIGTNAGDNLIGTSGSDGLFGGDGNDILSGLDGNDVLNGGAGSDQLNGGPGVNRFVFDPGNSLASASDIIQDWKPSDVIEFTGLADHGGKYEEFTAGSLAEATSIANGEIGAGRADYVAVYTNATGLLLFAGDRSDGRVDDVVQVSNGANLSSISAANIKGAVDVTTSGPPVGGSIVEPTFTPLVVGGGQSATGTITGNMDLVHIGHLLGDEITSATVGHLVLAGSVASADILGSGFRYDQNEQLIAGDLFSVDLRDTTIAGPFHATLTLAFLSAAPLGGWVANDATQLAFSSILFSNDRLDGGPGDDLIRGFDGNDYLQGGSGGNDTIYGGAGNDDIILSPASTGSNYLRGDDGGDVIQGGAGFDDANGNMGADTISTGAGDDYCVGGKDNDVLFGDAGNDIVWGNLGNDTCVGGEGADQVRGGQGDDVLWGDAGNDFVSGDRGNDTITGGAGADLFHDSQDAGIDRVLDFSLSEGDKVMLDPGTTFTVSQVGADTVIDMGGGNQMILVGVQMSTLPPGTIFLG